ncbi:hypothetical protein H4F99_10380 [Lysobacter sp. SG-8]|uniref:Uncharacterized protein n=1 Tax=Marilutibacter penaei TaxID=2759900 RepID=A0A7W3U4U5_9GAMM|nr:retron St85 family effector protein [Lysobacter penaei]MBB1088897.1 hypothetical protein [Lysobacter penaei]
MLEKHLRSEKSALHRHLSRLKSAVENDRIQPNGKHATSFVFICGANRRAGGASARRLAVERFIKKTSPDSKAIIAERFFEFLENSKKKQNLYDIEHALSGFADLIVIILESNSAFTELGAFATRELREKLFIINDRQFELQQSFINLGPLSAVKEVDNRAVSWYDMAADGIENGDAIGGTFPDLIQAIRKRSPKTEVLDKSKLTPIGGLNRWAFAFCHDIIFYSRSINAKDLVAVYTFLFGKADFDSLATYKALLVALGLATKSGDKVASTQASPILKSPVDHVPLQAAFYAANYRSERRS